MGVDIGGTFTDVVLQGRDGELRRWKAPSTPPDFERGVFAGIELAARDLGMGADELLGSLEELLHGTTVTTNVVLTRKGSRVALLTTRGFGDLYELARMYRNNERDPSKVTHPVPLVPRGDVFEILERVDYQGRVVVPIDTEELRAAVRTALDRGIESFAVCFLWSFRNPVHEREARRVILEEHPGAFVSISSEASPLLGEYERLSTTVITAFAGPELRNYTERLLEELRGRGFGGTLLLMKSDGGLGAIESTVASAGQTVYSGPVAGANAARALSESVGTKDLIAFDMGGTSTDVTLIEDGELRTTSLQFLDRQALATPMVDVTTVGAGGGSIATLAPDRTLRVGPESAGARPGPACYGRGGNRPTVTDANVVLGFLDPEYFLGGEMELDVEAAERVIAGLAAEAGLDTVAMAAGIFRVVNALMADAVRLRTVFAGLDPRRFTLVSYGGAGGLHCASVARELGVGRVIVPGLASVYSAAGLISTDLVYTVNRSAKFTLGPGGACDQETLSALGGLFAELEEQARESLAAHAVDLGGVRVRRIVEMSYMGQILNFEIDVPSSGGLAGEHLEAAVEEFDRRYAATYGTGAAAPEAGYEIKRARVVGTSPVPRAELRAQAQASSEGSAPVGTRVALPSATATELRPVSVYRAEQLGPGAEIRGPALVELPDSTILVPEGCSASIDPHFNLIIEVG